MWILLLILLGIIVYLAFRLKHPPRQEGSVRETPMDILKKRYASGEISKEEYERMKQDLRAL
jgi:putative membrane protein